MYTTSCSIHLDHIHKRNCCECNQSHWHTFHIGIDGQTAHRLHTILFKCHCIYEKLFLAERLVRNEVMWCFSCICSSKVCLYTWRIIYQVSLSKSLWFDSCSLTHPLPPQDTPTISAICFHTLSYVLVKAHICSRYIYGDTLSFLSAHCVHFVRICTHFLKADR